MDAASQLRDGLLAIAERSLAIMRACSNEESAKLYLVLPVLGALGYDYTNPHEVQPEFAADFRDAQLNKVDFAILRDGAPIVAVECKSVGTNLSSQRGQLRAYFNALISVKLGVLTNGIQFEFFVDSEEPHIMDDEPFLTLDLEQVALSGLSEEVLEAAFALTKVNFDPDSVAEVAQLHLVRKRLRTAIVEEVRAPSEELSRLLLQKVGLKNLRKVSIDRYYSSMVKAALEEAIVLPVLERLRGSGDSASEVDESSAVGGRIVTTERELAIFNYARRRLAYLATNEHLFRAIEKVQYQDYVGKLVVFYGRKRKGWLFDFIEGRDGYDKFVFPEPVGEVVTNNPADIDEPLRTVFEARVRELGEHRDSGSLRVIEVARKLG